MIFTLSRSYLLRDAYITIILVLGLFQIIPAPSVFFNSFLTTPRSRQGEKEGLKTDQKRLCPDHTS